MIHHRNERKSQNRRAAGKCFIIIANLIGWKQKNLIKTSSVMQGMQETR